MARFMKVYAEQGVVVTDPLTGHYGVNYEDNEFDQAWVKIFVVRHLSDRGSNSPCGELFRVV